MAPSLTSAKTKSLLDTLPNWLSSPEASYAFWIESHPSAESTKAVYRSMWNKFVRFLGERQVPLSLCSSEHIDLFFRDAGLVKEHRQRYIRLIENIFNHLHNIGLSIPNPGKQAALHALGKGDNAAMVFLSEEERERVESVILARLNSLGSLIGAANGTAGALCEGSREKEESEGSGLAQDALVVDRRGNGGAGAPFEESEKREEKRGKKKSQWKPVRDAAIAAVMLGGGATVSSIVGLCVNCTNCSEGKISLPTEGGREAHYEAPLLPIGQIALDRWLPFRRTLAGISDHLFPADIKSRGGKVAESPGMHPSTIFRAVRDVLHEAGIAGPRSSGQTLRNTYAATLISLHPAEDDAFLAKCLGLALPTSASLIRAAYNNQTNPTDTRPDLPSIDNDDDWLNDPLL